eukprot:TRINITY_DN55944_c0_g1_i1.p1 TRINITY_DN55944_c0_g1~~TRINITY_DN55944_c0_g1_i1.p1  ORF type:complete len:995 (+),score=256.11 TRINITY_DN55944_c0_g1_i1:177-2987(+)
MPRGRRQQQRLEQLVRDLVLRRERAIHAEDFALAGRLDEEAARLRRAVAAAKQAQAEGHITTASRLLRLARAGPHPTSARGPRAPGHAGVPAPEAASSGDGRAATPRRCASCTRCVLRSEAHRVPVPAVCGGPCLCTHRLVQLTPSPPVPIVYQGRVVKSRERDTGATETAVFLALDAAGRRSVVRITAGSRGHLRTGAGTLDVSIAPRGPHQSELRSGYFSRRALAHQRVVDACGLQDTLPREWVETVSTALPAALHRRPRVSSGVSWDWLTPGRAVHFEQAVLQEPLPQGTYSLAVLQDVPELNFVFSPAHLNSTAIRRLAVFDLLVSQSDRHREHFILDPSRPGWMQAIDSSQNAFNNLQLGSLSLPGTFIHERSIIGPWDASRGRRRPPNPNLWGWDVRCHAANATVGWDWGAGLRACVQDIAAAGAANLSTHLLLNDGEAGSLAERAGDLLRLGFEETLRRAVSVSFRTTSGRTAGDVPWIPSRYCCAHKPGCRKASSCVCTQGTGIPEPPPSDALRQSPPQPQPQPPPPSLPRPPAGPAPEEPPWAAPPPDEHPLPAEAPAPELATVRAADPVLAGALPAQYLPGLRSPCWHNSSGGGSLLCLPAFQIIGVSKSGTTDLFTKLRAHPDVSAATNKGPHWWDEDARGAAPYYVALYAPGAAAISARPAAAARRVLTGEASSNTYTASGVQVRGRRQAPHLPLLPALLRAAVPSARYVCVVREPGARLESAYFYYQRHSPQWVQNKRLASPPGFHEAVQRQTDIFEACRARRRASPGGPALPPAWAWAGPARTCAREVYHGAAQQLVKGLYALWWHDWHPPAAPRWARPLFVVSEELRAACPAATRAVLRHLGLRVPADGAALWGRLCDSSKRANVRAPAFSSFRMLPATRNGLDGFYGPYNAMLAALLARPHPLWPPAANGTGGGQGAGAP